jgi:MtN3 and saliva related transmembrane protein
MSQLRNGIISIFEILGITGSLIVSISVLPQIIKTYRTKKATDLSLLYLGILMTGLVMITLYSFYVGNLIFIFGNIWAVASTGILIVLCYRYRNSREETED